MKIKANSRRGEEKGGLWVSPFSALGSKGHVVQWLPNPQFAEEPLPGGPGTVLGMEPCGHRALPSALSRNAPARCQLFLCPLDLGALVPGITGGISLEGNLRQVA